uniref:Prefoldin subunit 4 n=1 Tax=Gongylonema pulchrum TaxID=637853 RepID=A0A183EAL2_9BILA
LQELNDAADEVLLLDEEDTESIPFLLGYGFLHFNQEQVNTELEEFKTELEEFVEELSEEQKKLNNQMASLKTVLYAKFGGCINLETDTDS